MSCVLSTLLGLQVKFALRRLSCALAWPCTSMPYAENASTIL